MITVYEDLIIMGNAYKMDSQLCNTSSDARVKRNIVDAD